MGGEHGTGELLLPPWSSQALGHSFIQQLFIEHLVYAAVTGTGDPAVKKQSPCTQGSYVLVGGDRCKQQIGKINGFQPFQPGHFIPLGTLDKIWRLFKLS